MAAPRAPLLAPSRRRSARPRSLLDQPQEPVARLTSLALVAVEAAQDRPGEVVELLVAADREEGGQGRLDPRAVPPVPEQLVEDSQVMGVGRLALPADGVEEAVGVGLLGAGPLVVEERVEQVEPDAVRTAGPVEEGQDERARGPGVAVLEPPAARRGRGRRGRPGPRPGPPRRAGRGGPRPRGRRRRRGRRAGRRGARAPAPPGRRPTRRSPGGWRGRSWRGGGSARRGRRTGRAGARRGGGGRACAPPPGGGVRKCPPAPAG